MATFGENFKKILRGRGLTQAAAAKLLDTTQSVISYYSNLVRPPRRGTLLNIADHLGVTVEELTGEKGVGQRAKQDAFEEPLSLDACSKQLINDAMRNLKRRWKNKPEERDAIRHLVPLIFPIEADRILNWFDEA